MSDVSTEMVPGMRAQGEGVKLFVEHDFAELRACIVGNPSAINIPDPDTAELSNLFEDSTDDEFNDYLRIHKGTNLKDSDPARYEKMAMESDALAAAYREAGVHVIRNETGETPDEIVEMNTGWGGAKFLSLFGQSAFEVIGHCLVSFWEVSPVRAMEMVHREAINQIMEHDSEAVWLTMPAPYPSRTAASPRPFLSPGDPRIFPNKLVVIGIGVADASHIGDRTKPRSSGDEFGAEILRRMLKPYGWRVENVYFDSAYTYHIDALMALIGEGIIGVPKGSLLSPLPAELSDWEVIDVDPEEQAMGACNSVPLPNKHVAIVQGAKKLIAEVEKRGYTAVEVPYQTIYDTFGSGIHCSTAPIWRQD